MKKIMAIPVFVFAAGMIYGQTREIDSLKQVLATTKEDTARVMALAWLSFRTAWKADNQNGHCRAL
jgi:hypothetical protein